MPALYKAGLARIGLNLSQSGAYFPMVRDLAKWCAYPPHHHTHTAPTSRAHNTQKEPLPHEARPAHPPMRSPPPYTHTHTAHMRTHHTPHTAPPSCTQAHTPLTAGVLAYRFQAPPPPPARGAAAAPPRPHATRIPAATAFGAAGYYAGDDEQTQQMRHEPARSDVLQGRAEGSDDALLLDSTWFCFNSSRVRSVLSILNMVVLRHTRGHSVALRQ